MNVFMEKEQRDCQSEPDRLLVEKASQGDHAAFETLVQRYLCYGERLLDTPESLAASRAAHLGRERTELSDLQGHDEFM